MNVRWIGAHDNNFLKGRDGKSVNKIVLHWIVGTLESADATFQKPDRIASSHYGIGDNDVHQYVQESDTAYHAGNLTVNKESVGIEHEGGPDLPISEATIQTSIQLVTELCRRYSLPADKDHIKRHSDIKATQCPGTLPVERIIEEVANNLLPPPSVITDQTKIPQIIDENGNVMEVQAIRSKLAELNQRVKSAESQLVGFVDKWFDEWKLAEDSNKSHQVLLEEEMGKHLTLEDDLNKYIDAIEKVVGRFDNSASRLTALSAVETDKQKLVEERDALIKKLNEANTPTGYKFIKSWDIFSLKWKLYKRAG